MNPQVLLLLFLVAAPAALATAANTTTTGPDTVNTTKPPVDTMVEPTPVNTTHQGCSGNGRNKDANGYDETVCRPAGASVNDAFCVYGDHCACRNGFVCQDTGKGGECTLGSGATVFCMKGNETTAADKHHEYPDFRGDCGAYTTAECVVGPANKFCEVDYEHNVCRFHFPEWNETDHHHQFPGHPPNATGHHDDDDRHDPHDPHDRHDWNKTDHHHNHPPPVHAGPNDTHHHDGRDPGTTGPHHHGGSGDGGHDGHDGHHDHPHHETGDHQTGPCCKAMTLPCLACVMGMPEDMYCTFFPKTMGCRPDSKHGGGDDKDDDNHHHYDPGMPVGDMPVGDSGIYDPGMPVGDIPVGDSGMSGPGFDDDDDHHHHHPWNGPCCDGPTLACMTCNMGVDATDFIHDLDYGRVTHMLTNNPLLSFNKRNSTAIVIILKGHNGDLAQWGADMLERAHSLLTGLTAADLGNLADDALFGTTSSHHDDPNVQQGGDGNSNSEANNNDGAWDAFGSLDWAKDQAATLADKFKNHVQGGIAGATSDMLKKAGTILEGLTAADIDLIAEAAWKGAKDAFKDLCKKKGAFDNEQVTAIKERVKKEVPTPADVTQVVVEDMGGLLGTLDEADLALLPEDVMDNIAPETIEVMGADKVAKTWEADKLDKLSQAAKNLVNGEDFAGGEDGKFSKKQIKALVGKAGANLGAFVDFVKKHDEYTNGDEMLAAIKRVVKKKFPRFDGKITKIQDSIKIATGKRSEEASSSIKKAGSLRRRRRRRLLTTTAAGDDTDGSSSNLESVVRVETSTNSDAAAVAKEGASEGSPTVVSVDATDTPTATNAANNAATAPNANGNGDSNASDKPVWFWGAVGGGCAMFAMAVGGLLAWRLKGSRAAVKIGGAAAIQVGVGSKSDLQYGQEIPKATYLREGGGPVTEAV